MPTTPDHATNDGETIAAVLADFQSLGDNCEFGIVQRYVGIEPPGLFRFVTAPLDALVAGLDNDFASYGAPGDLEIIAGHFDLLVCNSRTCGFAYSTGERVGSIDADLLLARHERIVDYLKRRLFEDLARGEKIFVRKGRPRESLDEVLALAHAVRRHGPSTILRVRRAEAGESPGSVRHVADGVMEGLVRRFSPYEGGMDIDLEPWIAICRGARRLAQGHQGPPPSLCLDSRPIRLQGRAALHATDADRAGMTIRTHDLGATLKPDTLYVFSLWVWIPREFSGEAVFAVLGRLRLAWLGADLGIRDAWQRIWISVRTPAEPVRLRVGYRATGPAGQRFWSTDWRLTEGAVPAAGPRPTIMPTTGIGNPWTRLLPSWGR